MTDHTGLLARIVRTRANLSISLQDLDRRDLADAVAIVGRAVLDATPGGDVGGPFACFYCLSEGDQPHQASCPVPVAKALLAYTDD